VTIDPATGLRAYPDQKDGIEEIFLAGTEPTEVAAPDAGASEDAGASALAPADAGGQVTQLTQVTPAALPPSPRGTADAGAGLLDAGTMEKPGEAPPF
jgi:hypothetical protein